MEGTIAYKEVENLKQRISDLEKENADLKKKLVEHNEPLPSPTCVPRPVWRPCLNPNWRTEGVS